MPPVNSDTVPQLLKSMSSCIQLTLHDGGRTETNGSACSAPRPPDAPPGPAAGAATVRKLLSDLGPLLTHSSQLSELSFFLIIANLINNKKVVSHCCFNLPFFEC